MKESLKKNKRKSKQSPKNSYTFEFRLRVVKLHLEEGFSYDFIEQETGAKRNTICHWVIKYRKEGEEGLRCKRRFNGKKSKIPNAVREKIIEEKKKNKDNGVRKISNILRRVFFLKASPETVRRTLHKNNLLEPKPKKKEKRNITRPRFFERSTPNQMWQTDIFCFRIGGKNGYLIGYIDDYSRFIVGLELFMSQKADQVIEVYRRAASEYALPKEMLTDNGRQYTSWRGKSRFEKELKKDKIHHIKARPHHPMTLGKIERFWQTIFQEFLSRAHFDSFENARSRIKLWVKYYNHKRPHQGIKGLCPADRYFEVDTALKQTIKKGIEENILEMALRGKPKLPFYMVGRMNGQSVVLQAEKGKLTLSVDDNKLDKTKELVYNLDEKMNIIEEDKSNEHKRETNESEEKEDSLQCLNEMPSGVVCVDGETQSDRSLQGVIGTVDATSAVADSSNRGDASSVRAESSIEERSSTKPEITKDAFTSVGGQESRSMPEETVGEIVESTGREIEVVEKSFQEKMKNISERLFDE